jgi:hypothetical protein
MIYIISNSPIVPLFGIVWLILIYVILNKHKNNNTNLNYPRTQVKYIRYSEMV